MIYETILLIKYLFFETLFHFKIFDRPDFVKIFIAKGFCLDPAGLKIFLI
jgi:hypothetical protein